MENSDSTNKLFTTNTSSNKPDNDSPPHKQKDKPNNPNYIPVLRKNNKTAYLFGSDYHNSVREAVFELPCKPFMPQDIPESLKRADSDSQSLYVCGQCRDCFSFSTTLEDHTARRSWILGYWCQHCFQVRCLHVPKGKPMCSTCLSSQFYKRAYLRTRGMKKGQRASIIRLFYNQCQFFSHLKDHNITSVEINDLMLMPLPLDVKKEDHAKLEKACKAIMEYGFLNRLHIMEFLRKQNAQGNWWDPPLPDPNQEKSGVEYTVAGIINTHRESDLIDKFDDSNKKNNVAIKNKSPTNKNNSNANKNSPSVNKGGPVVNKSSPASNKNNFTSNQNTSSSGTKNLTVSYYHSSYRPPADIAFVDCGPSHAVCKTKQTKPHYSLSQTKRESDIFVKNKSISGLSGNQVSRNSNQPPTTSTSTSIACSLSNKVYTMSTSNITTSTGPKISVKKFASEPASNWGQLGDHSEKSNNQTQPTNANTKILTVHSEKCLDLSSIISQLPPDVMNSKKIVFIEQNSNKIQYQRNVQGNKSSVQMSSVPTLSANCIKVVPQRRLVSKEKEKNKPIPILPAVSLSQVKQPSQPAFKNMTKSSFSVNSGQKMKTFAMSSVTKPVLKTVQIEQKIPPNQLYSQQIPINTSGVKHQQSNSYDGRIFYQSGKKYVIKQTNKIQSPSVPTNSILKTTTQIGNKVQVPITSIQVPNSVNYTMSETLSKPTTKTFPKTGSFFPNTISPLTPSPSPSELSSSSSCDAQGKQVTNLENEPSSIITFDKNPLFNPSKFVLRNLSISEQRLLHVKYDSSARLFLHMSKNVTKVRNTKNNVTRYRQIMLDSLPYLNKEQIQKRIDHVKKLSEDYSSMMQITDDREIKEHKRLIRCLEDSIEQAKLLNITERTEELSQKESETNESFGTLDNWEEQEMQKCPFCEKMKKPNNYLPGFSKLSTHESRYCQCHNCQCSTCNTFQGNLPRFAAHINYHEKNSPHTCPECLKKFSSFDSLEKHVWLNCFHPLVKNWLLGCKICGINGLFTFESLIRHFLMMHSERGFVCTQCMRVFFSENECRKHQKSVHKVIKEDEKEKNGAKNTNEIQNYQKEVSSGKNLYDPEEIIMCKVGRCIVLKENFKNHLIDHIGVEEQIFYKCPFCPFYKRESEGVKELFRDHMFSCHSHILPQYSNLKILNTVQESLEKQKSNNEVLPMIVNTRTIAQEAFEKGTQDEEYQDQDQGIAADKSNSGMPMIIDVRSEAVGLNSIENDTDSIPKILEVISIANDSLLKESRASESRKRKSSTAIEINLPPEKISSMDITNGEVAKKLIENNTVNFEARKENSIGRKMLIEEENTIDDENSRIEQVSITSKNNSIGEEILLFIEGNSTMNEQNSMEPTESPTVRGISSTSANALEDLKAKMSRTFKSLTKKMEATATTLQEECSKSLPKLKAISNVAETIQKSDAIIQIEGNKKAHPDGSIGTEDIFITSEKPRIDVQPPPLSRIPQYLLNSQPIVEDEYTTKKAKKRNHIEKIAFNGPLNYEETVLDFKCHVCGRMIDSSWPVLKSHFNLWHKDEYKVCVVNPQLLKISSDYIEGGYKEVLTKKYKCDSSPRKRRRRTRFAAKIAEKASLEKSAGICITTESVEEDDGTFKCKKCDLRCSDMGSLREHISKSHRIKGRYLICLECGENFVVAPSLQMHLKAFHAIDDPLTYLLQNTAFAPENMEDTEEEEEEVTIEANQCYVCMAVFEDKAAVDKHLRVHGMAFLNRKRIEAKKSLNSSENRLKMAVQTVEEIQKSNANSKLEENQVEITETVVAGSLETEVTVF